MKAIVKARPLAQAIMRIQTGIRKCTTALDGMVLLTQEGDTLSLHSFTARVDIRQTLAGVEGETGSVCADTATLAKVLKGLPGDTALTVTHSPGEDRMRVDYGTGALDMPVYDHLNNAGESEFPTLREFPEDKQVMTLAWQPLAHAIDRARTSRLSDSGRAPVLRQLRVAQLPDGRVEVAQTNGTALLHQEYGDGTHVPGGDTPLEVLIPLELLPVLAGVEGEEATVTYSASCGLARMEAGDLTLTFATEFQRYPDYHGMLGKAYDRTFTTSARHYAAMAARIAQFSEHEKIAHTFAEGTATLHGGNPLEGTYLRETLPASCTGADGFRTAYAYRLLRWLLALCHTPEITLSMDEKTACYHHTEEDGTEIHALICPCRYEEE